MSDAADDSTPTTVPFLRVKLLSILLTPLVPALVWGALDPGFGDGQLPPGAGLALFVVLSLIPLMWAVLFMLLAVLANAYAWYSSARSVHRRELLVSVLDLSSFLLFVAVAGVALTGKFHPQTLLWTVISYILFLATIVVHYLYLLYHLVAPGSGSRYTRLVCGIGFSFLYVVVAPFALESAGTLLSREFSFLVWFDLVVVILFLAMTATAGAIGYSHRLHSRLADRV